MFFATRRLLALSQNLSKSFFFFSFLSNLRRWFWHKTIFCRSQFCAETHFPTVEFSRSDFYINKTALWPFNHGEEDHHSHRFSWINHNDASILQFKILLGSEKDNFQFEFWKSRIWLNWVLFFNATWCYSCFPLFKNPTRSCLLCPFKISNYEVMPTICWSWLSNSSACPVLDRIGPLWLRPLLV